MLESLLKAGILTQATRKLSVPVSVTWRKPRDGWIKLNTHGALKDCGQAAGGVTQNQLGEVAWGFYEYYGKCSILEAKLKAVETGLRLCWQSNFNKVWVEVDSKAAMLLCIQKDKGPWEVQYTLESIHQYTSKMDIHFSHIWREGNKVVDWFANKGYIEKCFNLLQANELHGLIRGLIRMDKMNMASIRMMKEAQEEEGRSDTGTAGARGWNWDCAVLDRSGW
ncbi:RNase H domain-containing protein [Abeliophyllum distichum]|uniref:RNase H domain-containing protein n=1 Tax=Abeliophyllum distichum TaxID=126358 RepID=A0ABD1Q617_9LAMI